MSIEIRAMGFELTEAIRRHVSRRLKSAVGPFESRVQSVTARVEDVNAGRGGVDKRCSLVAAVRRRGVVVVAAVHENLYAAVDAAAVRMRRALRRHVTRRRAQARKSPPRPGQIAIA